MSAPKTSGVAWVFGATGLTNNVKWKVYIGSVASGQDISAAVFGTPTEFLFQDPLNVTAYSQIKAAVDEAGLAPGSLAVIRLQRDGRDVEDTSIFDAITPGLTLTWDES